MTDSVHSHGSRQAKNLRDVFVLGAGVSVPYGFPTGAVLLSRMRQEELSYSVDEDLALFRSGLEPNLTDPRAFSDPGDRAEYWRRSASGCQYARWKKLLRGSVVLSIDQFLKNLADDQLRTFGKQVMARQILLSERNSCVDPESLRLVDAKDPRKHFSMHSVDWIQQFLTRVDLLQNWEEYLRGTTFLTFNYDRVLEFYLMRYLQNDRNLSLEDAKEFLASLTILHLNGHLGSLEELPFGNLNCDSDFDPLFDMPKGKEKIIDWAVVGRRMRTVWENTAVHPEITKMQSNAREAVALSERIFVMGASFIPENFEAIGLTESAFRERTGARYRGHVLATTSGLSLAQKARATQLLGIREKQMFDMFANDFVVDHVVL